MQFSLRKLLTAAAIGPPLLAGGYFMLAAWDGPELRTLVVLGLAGTVIVFSLSAALRGDM